MDGHDCSLATASQPSNSLSGTEWRTFTTELINKKCEVRDVPSYGTQFLHLFSTFLVNSVVRADKRSSPPPAKLIQFCHHRLFILLMHFTAVSFTLYALSAVCCLICSETPKHPSKRCADSKIIPNHLAQQRLT